MKPIVVPEHVVDKGQFVQAWMTVNVFLAPLMGVIFGVGRVATAKANGESPPAIMGLSPVVAFTFAGALYAVGAFVLCVLILRAAISSRLPALAVRGLFRPQRLSIEENEIVRTSPVGGVERIPLTEETVGAVARDVLFLWASSGHGVLLALPLSAFASPTDRTAALRHLRERKVLRWGSRA